MPLRTSAKGGSLISKFSLKIAELFAIFSPKFRKICENFAEFSPHLTNFFRDFSKMQHLKFSKIFKMCNIFLGIFSKNCRFFRRKAGFSGHGTAKKVIVSITYRASCRRRPRSLRRPREILFENDSKLLPNYWEAAKDAAPVISTKFI